MANGQMKFIREIEHDKIREKVGRICADITGLNKEKKAEGKISSLQSLDVILKLFCSMF